MTTGKESTAVTNVIIGAGLAGLASAHGLARAGRPSLVLESEPAPGGHARSESVQGYWFDEGPHLSFTRDARVRRIFEEGVGGRQVERAVRIGCCSEGAWFPNPPQVHLYGLDPELVTRCIRDFVEVRHVPRSRDTYAQWLVSSYGRTFAEAFPMRYTRKYWTVDAAEMSTDWIRERMYVPTLEEVLRGALAPEHVGDFHYLTSYRYPESGGFQAFLGALERASTIDLGRQVSEVDVRRRQLRLADGTTLDYRSLISTMPLDRLVGALRGVPVPEEVADASRDLLCTSVLLVDVGLTAPTDPAVDFDLFYVYDEDISFSRVTLPHRLSPTMAPVGAGSLQAEVYFSRRRPLEQSPDDYAARVVKELVDLKVISDIEDVRFVRTREIPYANVVYDHRRSGAVDVIRPFLTEWCGITLAGRYGEWEYYWSDDAVNSGWRAAASVAGIAVDELLDGLPVPS